MNASSRAVLNKEEIERYSRDGFIVPTYKLSTSDVALLQELTIQMVEENPHLRDKFMTSPHVKNWGSQSLKSPRAHEWLDIAKHPDILDIVEQIIGPDIILWGTTLFYKRPLEGPATPWHRDAAYWPVKPLATTTVWIAVFDSVIENGCLRFIPGSHLPKQFGRHSEDDRPEVMFHHIMAEDEFDESLAKDVETWPDGALRRLYDSRCPQQFWQSAARGLCAKVYAHYESLRP
jgi:phytanoyl-CoA dioxygenase PhyH